MIPPYQTDEVAEAVRERLDDAGVEVGDLLVVADLRTREWRVIARLAPTESVTVTLPFTTPGGIVLPADVAARFLEEVLGT